MKFLCNNCKQIIELNKVKFTHSLRESRLVCKDAVCCDDYMNQIITDEYEGMPEIKRNEEHCKSSNYVKGLMKGE